MVSFSFIGILLQVWKPVFPLTMTTTSVVLDLQEWRENESGYQLCSSKRYHGRGMKKLCPTPFESQTCRFMVRKLHRCFYLHCTVDKTIDYVLQNQWTKFFSHRNYSKRSSQSNEKAVRTYMNVFDIWIPFLWLVSSFGILEFDVLEF